MIFFKDSKDKVFAFEARDVEHDNLLKARIAELNKKSSDLKRDVMIETLKSKIRISDALEQITETEKEDLLKPNQGQLILQHAREEHVWVKSELDNVEVQLMLHWTSDPRAKATVDAWSQYAQQLRNYTSTDDNGNPYIRDGETRPVSPLDVPEQE